MKMFSEDPDMSANIILGGFSEGHKILCQHKMASPCSDGLSFARLENLSRNDELPLRPNATSVSYIPHFLTKQKDGDFEEGVRQATGLVAERFDIRRRGLLKEGYFADIAIIDRNKLAANDEDPNNPQDPSGIRGVAFSDGLI